jgi:hypothetical protein
VAVPERRLIESDLIPEGGRQEYLPTLLSCLVLRFR